jgi:hypothetical protein
MTSAPHSARGVPRAEPPWFLTRRGGIIIPLLIVLPIGLGIVGVPKALYPLSDVADRIRAAKSPRVVEVLYQGANPIVGAQERIRILLQHDTTEAEGNAFWCTVVIPAGGGGLTPDRIQVVRNHQRAGESSNLAPDRRCSDSAPIR